MIDQFMYGDLDATDRVEPIETVLLVGFQGQTRLLTGTHRELWREFMVGDGGHGYGNSQPVGWHYFLPQDLGTARVEDCIVDHPIVAKLIEGHSK